MLFWRGRHEVREQDLSAYVDGELKASALQRVEAHLDVCAACRESVTELRAVRQSVKELPRVPVPRSFVLREADVAAEPAAAGTGLFASVTPLLSGVAAIAVVAFVVLAGFDIASDSNGFGDRDAVRTSGDSLSLEADSEAELAPSTENAVPPAVGLSDVDGTDGEDESEPGAGDLNGFTQGFEYGQDILTGDDARGGEPAPGSQAALAEDSNDTGLRIAEAVAAGIAVVAGGAALFIWWRRRTVTA